MTAEAAAPEPVEKVFTGEIRIPVRIRVRDDRVIRRCVENWDGNDKPAAPGTNGWRDSMYPLDTPEKVLEHLAYNRFVNMVEQVSRLDGWADLADLEIEEPEGGVGFKQLNPAVSWETTGEIEIDFLEEETLP